MGANAHVGTRLRVHSCPAEQSTRLNVLPLSLWVIDTVGDPEMALPFALVCLVISR